MTTASHLTEETYYGLTDECRNYGSLHHHDENGLPYNPSLDQSTVTFGVWETDAWSAPDYHCFDCGSSTCTGTCGS